MLRVRRAFPLVRRTFFSPSPRGLPRFAFSSLSSFSSPNCCGGGQNKKSKADGEESAEKKDESAEEGKEKEKGEEIETLYALPVVIGFGIGWTAGLLATFAAVFF